MQKKIQILPLVSRELASWNISWDDLHPKYTGVILKPCLLTSNKTLLKWVTLLTYLNK